jgi:hypothetical protein
MDWCWCDPVTGTVLSEGIDEPAPSPREGAILLRDDEIETGKGLEHLGSDQIETEILERYCSKKIELTAHKEAIAKTLKARLAKIDLRLKRLERYYSYEVNRILFNRVGHLEKKRYLDLSTGRIGIRKSPWKRAIDDDQSAINWAKVNCPDAIKTEVSLLKSLLPKKGYVPGTQLVQEEKIYTKAGE